MAVYKVNVSLPEELVTEIDEVALDLGVSRSSFIAEASTRYVADVKNLSAEEQRRKDVQRAIATFKRIGRQMPPGSFERMMQQLRADRDRDTPPEQRR